MTDNPENFAARRPPAPEPEAPQEEPEDLAELFDRVAPEGLAAEEPPKPPAQEPPKEEPRRAPFTGYGPNIEALNRQIEELDAKLDRFRAADSPYVIDDGNGGRQYDFASYQDDDRQQRKLIRQRDDLRQRAQDRKEAGREQQQTAVQLARAVLNEKLGSSRMPKEMKDAVVRMYREAFDSTTAQGIWAQPQFADRSKMRLGLAQMLDTIVGQVAQQQYKVAQTPSDERGLDERSGGEPPAVKEDEDDDYTKQLMTTYGAGRGARKTIGQIRREQREAAMKGGGNG